MMDDAVDDRGGHGVVAKDGAPPGEFQIRGEDEAAFFVAV
ncbi:hypothetical protein GCM10027092_30250 [Yaniella soli]